MTVNLTIPIECGGVLCCDETKTFCRFNLLHKQNWEATCELFDVDLYNDVWGYSMRCKQCKEAEGNIPHDTCKKYDCDNCEEGYDD
jgi:hypothetical protein